MIEVERSTTVPDGWGFRVRVSEADGQTRHQVALGRT
jgi:hypothetical protein